jgi:hypothetical protein
VGNVASTSRPSSSPRRKNFHLLSTASDVDDTVKPSAAGFAAVDP